MDDEYNVISTGFGDDNQDDLVYPTNDEEIGIAVVGGNDNQNDRRQNVLDCLEEVGLAGHRKRRFEEVQNVYDEYGNDSHPADWFMRANPKGDFFEDQKVVNAAKRKALEDMKSKINEPSIDIENVNRTEIDEIQNPGSIGSLYDAEMSRRFKRRQEVMSNPPFDGTSWLGITDSIVGRIYVRTFREQKTVEPLIQTVFRQLNGSNVGFREFQTVVQEAEEIRRRKAEADSRQREEKMSALLNEQSFENDENIEPTVESSLWVNKYDAKNFSELLSDDIVNRNILTWMKLWDECVFKQKVDNMINSLNDRDKEIFQLDDGKVRRPHFKVLLLSGPAGLGKTTLARIVARQAGYSTSDVNASDARTVADLNKVLEGAVKTSKTLDSDQRPVCLILDEIDGAPVETIRHLIRFIQQIGKKAVRRPIIGICNNLFTPALRELRSVAWCVQLGATKTESLTKRLQQICDKENLKCDQSTLRKLCELCASDMRHSINTLQWAAVAAKKTNRVIGLKLVHEVIEKEKSGATSIFEHWSAVLELSKHNDGKGGIKSVRERVYQIEKISADHGGEERFISGLHANYLVSMPIGLIRKATEWFMFHDKIQKIIHSQQNWSVMKYTFSFLVSIHLTIATYSRVHISYPQLEQNMFSKTKESEETLSAVRAGGDVGKGASKKDLLLDLLPLLVRIVQPPIKPMNEQLYSQRDLAIFNSTVAAMCEYGLTYSATMVKDQVHWLFAPSIDVLTMFPIADIRRHSLANATRQLIAHKISHRMVVREDAPKKTITNANKIKEIIEKQNSEKSKEKRLSIGAMKRLKNAKLADVSFVHQEGDSSAVKKKITMHELSSIIFGES